MTGPYEFPMFPCVYELVRRMISGSLGFRRLESPDWLVGGYTIGYAHRGIGVATLYVPIALSAMCSVSTALLHS